MKRLLFILGFLYAFFPAVAQHEHHQHQPTKQPVKKAAPVKKTTAKKVAPKKTPAKKTAVKTVKPAVAIPAAKSPATQIKEATHEHEGHILQHADTAVHADGHEHDHGAEGQHDHDSEMMHDPAMHGQHMQDEAMQGHEGHDMGSMSHAFSLNLPMNRNGSGTGWLPDASPMYGYMRHSGDWMFMFHGNVFLRYNNQDFTNKGTRGDSKVDAPNWLMAMGQRKVGKNGLFHFSTMFSADALIAGGSGYPLLFQTGETWQGHPLVDRQHPHDLFSELSVSYAHALSRKADVFVYLGYPGEPAIGPVAFMHRPSALPNPDAPLSHHWTDATHITFGVATLGVRYGKFKLEGSSFTGREPDENRYDFNKPRFDSWSGRLSFNPSANWALQVSHGFLKSPETIHPDDVNRTTASVIYSYPLGMNKYLNASGVWGVNKVAGHDGEHALLLEAAVNLNRLALYGRFEYVQKSAEELDLHDLEFEHDALFNVDVITLGAAYDILHISVLRLAAGGQLTRYHADSRLDVLYGNNPMAVEIYLRLYPDIMRTSR